MVDTCRGCGAIIPDGYDVGGRQPCPACGNDAGRIVNVSAHCGITSSLSAIWSIVLGHTGREVQGTEALTRATEWANLPTREEMLLHPCASDFQDLLQYAACLTGASVQCVRGRGINDGSNPTPDQMGPPPLHVETKGGRYDRPGDHMLYLSDSEDGVLREYGRWYKSGSPHIQKYRLPLDSLRIADFTDGLPDHFITAVFSKAEECNVDGRGSPGYVFSQFIGELVAAQFDGMKIPGVRGAPGAHYTNIVLFRPHPHWQDWLAPGATPYRLSHPHNNIVPNDQIESAAYFIWENSGKHHGNDWAHWFAAEQQLNPAKQH